MSLKRGLFILYFVLFAPASQAAFDLSILNADNLNEALPDDVAKAAVKTFGIFFVHRPYDGAVSMFNTNALDLKFEVTMMKVGSDINDALAANGLSTNTSASTVALPVAKVHLRKPLSPAADIGVSGIYYQGQYAIGTDIKFELNQPEEGINTALRLSYSYATATVLYLKSVTVLTSEFVMSRKLDFAEPYFCVGGRYITGTVSIPFDLTPLPVKVVEKTANAFTAYATTGVNFQILGPKGFRLGMEGTYDVSGFSSIGTMFGIGF